MDVEALVVDAFAQLGFDTVVVDVSAGAGNVGDLMVDPDGVSCHIDVKYRSLVSEDIAVGMTQDAPTSGAALLVVADRVTGGARKVLTSQRGGYLDLRGRLALRSEKVVVDAEVDPVKARVARTGAFSGKAGLEVATELLMNPGRPVVVREVARAVRRAPSTVSEILAGLRRDQLIDATNSLIGTDLFWAVASRWATPRIYLAEQPADADAGTRSALRLGLDDVEHGAGWALTDSVAALAYGAPLAARSGQMLDFFLSDQAIVRRAATLLGTASATTARAAVRVAPVPAVVHTRVGPPAGVTDWPLVHPVFVALDLAQDVGRGREILDAWTPDERWPRVW